ncbi:MAG TPA: asparagine synthase [Methanoregulaceae archaeon]|nr:asparagine synthase [Methanoregulaceae archaeon]
MHIRGWAELGGRRLGRDELRELVRSGDPRVGRLGGEFCLAVDDWRARDRLGIIPGDCRPGTLELDGVPVLRIEPEVPDLPLADAIKRAVALRSDEGVTALSGGVDSTLVAALAGRPCIAVGVAGSHDLDRARRAADLLGLDLTEVEVSPCRVEEALGAVIPVIPDPTNPVEAAIAATLFFVAEWAGAHGYECILAGQGADELFGGYARYLEGGASAELLARDFASLPVQSARDQAVAGLFGCTFSLPYLDCGVVRAARALPPASLVSGGLGKQPLRAVAAGRIPAEIAAYPKKAMQYGSGIWREVRRLSRHNGYKNSVQGYLITLERNAHGR